MAIPIADVMRHHGRLSVQGNFIVDQFQKPFQLRGMSLFWSQWMPQFYNPIAVKWLRDDWCCNALRVAMAVNFGGYNEYPDREWAKVALVIDSAVSLGIYVIVDWHCHELELESAIGFFQKLTTIYGNCPNIIYEIWNEPYPVYDWVRDIRPYHETLIAVIRELAPDSLIIAGTENYSQRPDIAAMLPLFHKNVAYAVHFYSATHKQKIRLYCQNALDRGAALLASEYGTCEASGDGAFDAVEAKLWWEFLDNHKVGHFNWSIADKDETASALLPGANPDGGWPESDLTPSGALVREHLRSAHFRRDA